VAGEEAVKYPPFPLKRRCLYWLRLRIEHYRDSEALELLWWQASIGPGGANEGLTRVHWAARA